MKTGNDCIVFNVSNGENAELEGSTNLSIPWLCYVRVC